MKSVDSNKLSMSFFLSLFDLCFGFHNQPFRNRPRKVMSINLSIKIIDKYLPNRLISLVSGVFANDPRDQGSIQGQVIPKTQKMVFDASLLNTYHYKVWIKGKWSNPGKGVTPSPTSRCSSYRKGSLRVTHDYSRQLTYLTHTHVCVCVCVCLFACVSVCMYDNVIFLVSHKIKVYTKSFFLKWGTP